MQVLVIGANGFVGAAVCRKLSDAGLRVRATCAPGSPRRDAPVDWIEADLDDPHAVARAAEGCDAALHLDAHDLDLPRAEALRHGIARVRALLDGAERARVRRFIHTGCACALGRPTHPATERDALIPGRSRHPRPDAQLAIEWEVLAANSYAMTTSTLLPALVAGPGAPPRGVAALIDALIRAQLPALPRASLPLVDLRDLADAHLAALQRARPAQRYALAASPIDLSDLARAVADATRATPPRLDLDLPDLPRWLERAAPALARLYPPAAAALDLLTLMPAEIDAAKARLELAFNPRHPLVTVQDTIASLTGDARQGLRPA